MNQMSKLDAFIQQAVTAMPISGTSLIASLYGDALLQRGGEVWLGSVAALLEGLGFGERFVRTALFRLNKEEWLDVVRIGRRSFYRLSDKGLRLTRRAEHKIYRASAPEWDGTWLLLLSEGLEKNVLADVKKQLLWQGFGALAPSLLASPSQKLADVQSLLHEAGVAEIFCSVCGIYTFHQRRSNPQQYGVNVACIDGVSPFDFPCVEVNDGVNHPKDGGGGVVGYLRYEKK